MKLSTFFRCVISVIRSAVSFIPFAGMTAPALACGPYPPIIPTPDFFMLSGSHKAMADYEREENLLLWQSITSKRIPLEDIEQVVYHDSEDDFVMNIRYEGSPMGSPKKTKNMFYAYLNNTNDCEVIDFLRVAKYLEEKRQQTSSPWYYPQDRSSAAPVGDYSYIIDQCRAYNGNRLKDRYALQQTRVLFASRQYAACVEYVDSAFADVAETNLMKRMAQRYVAGCWSRLGYIERADSLFAHTGDVWSIQGSEPAVYMSEHNPGAPQLMEYIRSKADDKSLMRALVPVAKRLLTDHRVRNKGDWYFLLAYIVNEHDGLPALAHTYINRAMQQDFSTVELRDLGRAYKMRIDACRNDSQTLLADIKWMETMSDVLNPSAGEWIRRCRNVIYEYWVPELWRRRQYATAILLCGYADNLIPSCQRHTSWRYGRSVTIKEIRDSEQYKNPTDYSCLSFQLMGSLSSSQLALACARMRSSTPLYDFLRRKVRTDSDYYDELIGTLALREENYARAEKYLSRVSDRYLRTMNIDKDGYLSRDPFLSYPSRGSYKVSVCQDKSCIGAKLDFARKMRSYSQTIRFGRTADERGLARLRYAIGRRNSFEECWALTQYWRGWCGIFEPRLNYGYNVADSIYDFLYDYERTVGHNATEALYYSEIKSSLAMLTTDEARAKARYILGNLATVVRCYGKTTTAEYVRSSCDNWKSWL